MGLEPITFYFPQKMPPGASYYKLTYVDSDAVDIINSQADFNKIDPGMFIQAGGLITAYGRMKNKLYIWNSSKNKWQ